MDSLQEPDLGYIFYSAVNRIPVNTRLDVILRPEPTLRHFDPLHVRFDVACSSGTTDLMTVYHPWAGLQQYHVCPGRVYIEDRLHKQVEAFALGGDLTIIPAKNKTVCTFASEAPIFELAELQSLATTIAIEIEVLLAIRRADWDPKHPHTFEQHMATVDPHSLYMSCLAALHDQFANNLEEHNQTFHKLVQFVAREMEEMQLAGEWPPIVPTLAELL